MTKTSSVTLFFIVIVPSFVISVISPFEWITHPSSVVPIVAFKSRQELSSTICNSSINGKQSFNHNYLRCLYFIDDRRYNYWKVCGFLTLFNLESADFFLGIASYPLTLYKFSVPSSRCILKTRRTASAFSSGFRGYYIASSI